MRAISENWSRTTLSCCASLKARRSNPSSEIATVESRCQPLPSGVFENVADKILKTIPVASNRVAVFTGPGQVELRTDPPPEPARGEALVQIRACALCTMEQRLWNGSLDDYPIAAGHETAGIVVAVHAEGVVGVSAGERVAIAFLDRCMQCEPCRRGDTHLCTGKLRGRKPNVFRRIGGLAD